MRLVIESAPENYTPPERDGLVMVKCDCTCGDPCPQGLTGSAACFVWMDKKSVKKRKYRTIYR